MEGALVPGFFRFLELKRAHLEVVEGDVVYQVVTPSLGVEKGDPPPWSFGTAVIQVGFGSAQELRGSKSPLFIMQSSV